MVAEQSLDIEMKVSDVIEDELQDVNLLTLEDIKEQVKLIEKAVLNKEPRFLQRVLRTLPITRKRLSMIIIKQLILSFYTHSSASRDQLLQFIEENGDRETVTLNFRPRSGRQSMQPLLPEVDIYLHLLLLIYLLDAGKNMTAVKCAGELTAMLNFLLNYDLDELMKKIVAHNKRSLDLLAAKSYFYYSRSYELTDQLSNIRTFLHSRFRMATLRSDYEGQAVLINCLLRNYLKYNLYDQADKLVSKSSFPEHVSNNEWARFQYYMGRIKAIQLKYSEAHRHLLQAQRKAPQHAAIGFKQTVQKLLITVELLLGEIPERQLFLHASTRHSLIPYFQLTQAVRMGDLARFGEVLENFGNQFELDHTYSLILRLRHNVIKTALRSINLSYSRISLADIASKLMLDNSEDAEYIVAKCIRDGVIEAIVDHENNYVQSKEPLDIYSSQEPQLAFHQRINFCLNIHNHSVKALRFPPRSYNKDLESAEDRREREQQDLEMAKEMAEEEDDSFP